MNALDGGDLRRQLVVLVTSVLLMACPPTASAGTAVADLRLTPVSRIGWEADKTTGGDVCVVASHDECQFSKRTRAAGGFDYPDSVASDSRTGHLYVAEINNNRVQELTSSGAFVSTFGWGVNGTKDERSGAGQAEKNLCVAKSTDRCDAGMAGRGAGKLDSPESIAVDPASGDVYVSEIGTGDLRVDKYTASGRFVWRIGQGVNRITGGNLCSARDIEAHHVRCGAGAADADGGIQRGAFKFANQSGNLLAVDGQRHLLFIGDEHRVQVFRTDGHWERDISLVSLSAARESSVVGLALDGAGELYVVYRVGSVETLLPSEHANIIHKFNRRGEQVAEYPVVPTSSTAVDSINGISVNREGHLAVMGVEVGADSLGRFGCLYDARSGEQIGSFPPSADNDGIALGEYDKLYVATAVDNEVVVYGRALTADRLRSPALCEALAIGDRSCG